MPSPTAASFRACQNLALPNFGKAFCQFLSGETDLCRDGTVPQDGLRANYYCLVEDDPAILEETIAERENASLL